MRFYLNRTGISWSVAVSTGIASPDAGADQSAWFDGSLGEANEVAGLSGLM